MKSSLPDTIQVLTVDEIAAYLRVHQSTIYRLLKGGRLPAFRLMIFSVTIA
jgi:predicted DNA-binding transcriptional regulator AlpA